MPKLSTLVDDISNLLGKGEAANLPPLPRQVEFGSRMVQHLLDEIAPKVREDKPDEVYVTQVTSICDRQNWHKINGTKGETISGDKRFKFLFGDMIEEATLILAEAAGHEVEQRQRRLEVPLPSGKVLVGRIDAVIDGELVDVKSVTNFGYDAYFAAVKSNISVLNDPSPFDAGYYNQLDMYRHMMHYLDDMPITASLLPVNKLNGDMLVVPVHTDITTERDVKSFIEDADSYINQTKGMAEPRNALDSGQLSTMCSYCPFKFECFPDLEVFAYAKGPVFIPKDAHGAKKPMAKVPNITAEYKAKVKIET